MRIITLLVFISATTLAWGQDKYGEWYISRDTDELRGLESILAGVVVDHEPETRGMGVRCKGGELLAMVVFGKFLNNEPIPVAYKFDDGEIHRDQWRPNTNGTAVIADDARSIARRLMEARRFVIEVQDYQGTPHQQSFPLNGSLEAIRQTLKACPES